MGTIKQVFVKTILKSKPRKYIFSIIAWIIRVSILHIQEEEKAEV